MTSARTASLARSGVLVEDMEERDSATLESVVTRNWPLVTHLVYRTIGRRADAEDVCQEVFLRVCQGFLGFRFESKASTWIARIAYNTCMNYLHKKREVLLGDLPGTCSAAEAVPSKDARPDESVEREELTVLLEELIQTLPPHFRAVLTLFHLEGMNYREIGEVMSLPEGTVKSYLFRARRQLRRRLMRRYSQEDLRP